MRGLIGFYRNPHVETRLKIYSYRRQREAIDMVLDLISDDKTASSIFRDNYIRHDYKCVNMKMEEAALKI